MGNAESASPKRFGSTTRTRLPPKRVVVPATPLGLQKYNSGKLNELGLVQAAAMKHRREERALTAVGDDEDEEGDYDEKSSHRHRHRHEKHKHRHSSRSKHHHRSHRSGDSGEDTGPKTDASSLSRSAMLPLQPSLTSAQPEKLQAHQQSESEDSSEDEDDNPAVFSKTSGRDSQHLDIGSNSGKLLKWAPGLKPAALSPIAEASPAERSVVSPSSQVSKRTGSTVVESPLHRDNASMVTRVLSPRDSPRNQELGLSAAAGNSPGPERAVAATAPPASPIATPHSVSHIQGQLIDQTVERLPAIPQVSQQSSASVVIRTTLPTAKVTLSSPPAASVGSRQSFTVVPVRLQQTSAATVQHVAVTPTPAPVAPAKEAADESTPSDSESVYFDGEEFFVKSKSALNSLISDSVVHQDGSFHGTARMGTEAWHMPQPHASAVTPGRSSFVLPRQIGSTFPDHSMQSGVSNRSTPTGCFPWSRGAAASSTALSSQEYEVSQGHDYRSFDASQLHWYRSKSALDQSSDWVADDAAASVLPTMHPDTSPQPHALSLDTAYNLHFRETRPQAAASPLRAHSTVADPVSQSIQAEVQELMRDIKQLQLLREKKLATSSHFMPPQSQQQTPSLTAASAHKLPLHSYHSSSASKHLQRRRSSHQPSRRDRQYADVDLNSTGMSSNSAEQSDRREQKFVPLGTVRPTKVSKRLRLKGVLEGTHALPRRWYSDRDSVDNSAFKAAMASLQGSSAAGSVSPSCLSSEDEDWHAHGQRVPRGGNRRGSPNPDITPLAKSLMLTLQKLVSKHEEDARPAVSKEASAKDRHKPQEFVHRLIAPSRSVYMDLIRQRSEARKPRRAQRRRSNK